MSRALASTIVSDCMFRIFIIVSMLLSSCKPELNEPNYTAGDADFSVFLSIGGGTTAGMTDNALLPSGQLNSFPALLSTRFQLVNGGAFIQPVTSLVNGFSYDFLASKGTGKTYFTNKSDCKGLLFLKSDTLPFDSASFRWLGSQGPFNNMGVPGARSFNFYSQTFGKKGLSGNPFFFRMASDTGGTTGLSSTVLGDAARVEHTFFTMWVGMEDVLFYALSGGEPSSAFFEITPVVQFNAAVDTIVNALVANGASGVVASIPDIEDLPYFNAIPYNGLSLTQAEADSLNQVSPPGIGFEAGLNAYVVANPGGGSIRQLGKGELIMLNVSMDSLRCGTLGTPQRPILSTQVIDSSELALLHNAVTSYNNKLRNAATARNLAFADMHALYKSWSRTSGYNGAAYSNAYITGGIFSSDGLHPTGRGYAIIANEFIRVINTVYKSNLPPCDVNSYAGFQFP